MSDYGFLKVAVASPKLKVANPAYNITEIMKLTAEAEKNDAAIVVFPELAVTGYTCGDLFHQQFLLDSALEALGEMAGQTREDDILCIVGIPLRIEDRLFNCAVVLKQGRVLGVVPKMHLPNHGEFYEKRWFSSGLEIGRRLDEIELLGQKVPFGNLLFGSRQPRFTLGVEICEDLWALIPPSSYLTSCGAEIISNLSASNELAAKSDYRRQLVSQQSARSICAYLFASAGVYESTTDLVFGGESLICENGAVIGAAQRFSRESTVVFAEIDLDILRHDRQLNKNFAGSIDLEARQPHYNTVEFSYDKKFNITKDTLTRLISQNPFVPSDPLAVAARCEEIFNIQVAGLAKRLEHTGSRHAVIGVSGGLDSALALLVAKKSTEVLGMPAQNVVADYARFGTGGNPA